MKLRDYQEEGLKQIWEAWEVDDVCMFVLATGGGKTVTFTELMRECMVNGKRCMLIAHREELINQAWTHLYENKILAGVIKAEHVPQYNLPVQVCSIQTIIRRRNLPAVDYIIIDEAHHAQRDNSYGEILKRYPSAKVLLVTATPYRLSGDGFEYVHPYKPTRLILNRNLKQLQDDGWLVPIRYFAASLPDLDKIHLSKGDYIEEESHKAMELAPIVQSYREHVDGMGGICFCINIAHSQQVVKQYNDAGIPAAHLDASTPKEERRGLLDKFRQGLIKVICNVGIITEGFDFPNLDFVQLARPTKSLSLYMQMVGRVTRAMAGVVDGAKDTADRLNRIKQSKKPAGIVLDNAGCWVDHNLPDHDIDWEYHFRGRKKAPKKLEQMEMMEMLIFVAERPDGTVIRTTNAKEIEGLKLIEITVEQKNKMKAITSVKEFDRLYALFRNSDHILRPGDAALNTFIEWCKKQRAVIIDDIWYYLERKLVAETEVKLNQMQLNHKRDQMTLFPNDLYDQERARVQAQGLSRWEFEHIKAKYMKQHAKAALKVK
jgi:superfamily II DNA or RNA helicase